MVGKKSGRALLREEGTSDNLLPFDRMMGVPCIEPFSTLYHRSTPPRHYLPKDAHLHRAY
ncbi:hypothetical protein BAUCODRAFT_37750 [Baudoinia panamericana UAMH 10762]|uniref:Uncharacterized protein n=1 Tax=Baudoinia panamericana (strain UAMH 10762) TaxID=717646 RepID=M2MN13_BAUPA|nr:uncharacterized protein BAUCODRAFT_37750 [Baudoinia panamericana UAMH 10762]EMC92838.1 hypothetical protein BAUCODRAFT_37750 [Baudoinia panamericana UAMH 10762]